MRYHQCLTTKPYEWLLYAWSGYYEVLVNFRWNTLFITLSLGWVIMGGIQIWKSYEIFKCICRWVSLVYMFLLVVQTIKKLEWWQHSENYLLPSMPTNTIPHYSMPSLLSSTFYSVPLHPQLPGENYFSCFVKVIWDHQLLLGCRPTSYYKY